MKKRISRCFSLYVAVAARAVAAFLCPKNMPLSDFCAKFNISETRVMYYNIMIIMRDLVADFMPAGSSFAVLPGKTMALKTISITIFGACALSCFAPSAAFAAGETAQSVENSSAAVAAVEQRTASADPEQRALAAAELGGLKSGRKRAILKNLLADKDPRVRAVAARGLARDGDASAYPALAEALNGADGDARLAAVEGLAYLKDARAERPLIDLLKYKDLPTRAKAAETLGNFKSKTSADALLAVLNDEGEDANVRRSALMSLVKIGDKASVPGLKAFRSARVPKLEKLAAQAAAALEKKK